MLLEKQNNNNKWYFSVIRMLALLKKKVRLFGGISFFHVGRCRFYCIELLSLLVWN